MKEGSNSSTLPLVSNVPSTTGDTLEIHASDNLSPGTGSSKWPLSNSSSDDTTGAFKGDSTTDDDELVVAWIRTSKRRLGEWEKNGDLEIVKSEVKIQRLDGPGPSNPRLVMHNKNVCINKK